MRSFYFFFLFVSLAANSQQAALPIGSWREHLPYHRTLSLAATDQKIFAATPYSLFSVHTATGEMQRFSKLNGLAETGVSAIGYEATKKKLVVAYRNGNIDILSENSIINVSGLKREQTQDDKTVFEIYTTPGFSYLATGLGILELDLDRAEIRDSWFIGAGGAAEKVFSTAHDDQNFYAATASGLKMVPTGAYPGDFKNWISVAGLQHVTVLRSWQGQMVALQHDSLFVSTASGWQFFYTDGWNTRSIHVSENLLALMQTRNGGARILFLNKNGAVVQLLENASFIAHPTQALKKGDDYWISDSRKGLSRWNSGSFSPILPDSPKDIARGELKIRNGILLAAAGTVDAQWNATGNKNGYFRFWENEWTTYSSDQHPVFDTVPDIITVAIDPRDGTSWAGSFGGGLVHQLPDGKFITYKQASPLRPASSDPGSYKVSGLVFDAFNHLWVSNYGSAQGLHVLKNNNSWQSFKPPFALGQNAVAGIIVDDVDQKWIISPQGNGLLVFNHGTSLENTGDDRWKLYREGALSGNLPSSNVLSIARDPEGAIWVGTDDGIAIIPCPWDVFASGCPAILPVVRDGGFSNYLFKGEQINSIAVDGAGRKWIGSANGAWLVTSSGEKVLARFTEANSPLLNDTIHKVVIDGISGEVFFATASGICSFRGSATESSGNNDELLIFPNPVPPGYGGTIAIKGLAPNSFVKITELNGRLAFQARALGGQAVWDGRDYRGRKLSSGVYLVLVIDENKQEKKMGRIVFINK